MTQRNFAPPTTIFESARQLVGIFALPWMKHKKFGSFLQTEMEGTRSRQNHCGTESWESQRLKSLVAEAPAVAGSRDAAIEARVLPHISLCGN
jgi:hypothetical protein